jgi:hypothetical protein
MQKQFMAKRTSLSCHAMIIQPSGFDFILDLGFLGVLGGLGG